MAGNESIVLNISKRKKKKRIGNSKPRVGSASNLIVACDVMKGTETRIGNSIFIDRTESLAGISVTLGPTSSHTSPWSRKIQNSLLNESSTENFVEKSFRKRTPHSTQNTPSNNSEEKLAECLLASFKSQLEDSGDDDIEVIYQTPIEDFSIPEDDEIEILEPKMGDSMIVYIGTPVTRKRIELPPLDAFAKGIQPFSTGDEDRSVKVPAPASLFKSAMVDRLVNSEVNARRVANVEQCFGKMSEPLQTFGRVLVGEGVLVKMCRKKPKQRQFFLFNDILVYGNIVISKKRYNKQRIIRLEGVQLEDLTDEGGLKNGWIIKTPAKSFAVYAATSTEKKEWMLHIQRCVTDLLSKGNKEAAKEHAAVWVPDGEAARCMACGRTHFSIVQRRHHCRSCGHVVCGSCSSHTFRIDNVNKKPVRVCDSCYDRLKNGGQPVLSGLPNMQEANEEMDRKSGESTSDSDEEPAGSANERRPTFYREEEGHPFN